MIYHYISASYCPLHFEEVLPVAHVCIRADASIKTGAVGVRGARHVLAFSGQAATQSRDCGWDGNQGSVPTIQNWRRVTKHHPAGTATCGTAVCVGTFVHPHLHNADTQGWLQLKEAHRHRSERSRLADDARTMQKMKHWWHNSAEC